MCVCVCVCVYYSLFCRTYSTQYVFILLLNWLCTLSAPLPAEHFLCASLAPLQPRIQGMASDIIVEILHQETWAKAFAGTGQPVVGPPVRECETVSHSREPLSTHNQHHQRS